MNHMFTELTPKQERSKVLKEVYRKWKESGEEHMSPSGMTANYIGVRALREGVSFTLRVRYLCDRAYTTITRD